MRKSIADLGIAVRLTVIMMVLTGLIYPLVITGAAQALFRDRANGSLIKDQSGTVVGSSLIGQNFTSDKYFHGRPSATLDSSGNPAPYNAANSSASNLGPTNPALILAVEQNADALRCADGLPPGPPPLVTATPAAAVSPRFCDADAGRRALRELQPTAAGHTGGCGDGKRVWTRS